MTKIEQARKLLAEAGLDAVPVSGISWVARKQLENAAVNQYTALLDVVEAAKGVKEHSAWCAWVNAAVGCGCTCGVDNMQALIQKWEELA